MSVSFQELENALIAKNDANIRLISSNFEQSKNGVIALGSSKIQIISSNFINNLIDSVNIVSSGSGTHVTVVGSLFHGNDFGGCFGIGLKVLQGAYLEVYSSHLDFLETGCIVGNVDDTSDTQLIVANCFINENNNDLVQNGSSTVQLSATSIDMTLVTINDSTNVTLTTFDLDNSAVLNVGNTKNIEQSLLQINNGDDILPEFKYHPKFYGYDSLVYSDGYSNNGSGVGFGIVGNRINGNVTSLVTSVNRNGSASIVLQSDTGIIGNTDSTRGWSISRDSSDAVLTFSFENKDNADGKSLVQSYTVMQLDGFNNNLSFPNSYNDGTQIIWQDDTNLYRSNSKTLQTDGNFVVTGTGTINGTLVLATGSIKDSTGLINFDDNQISTTGPLESGSVTVTGITDVAQLKIVGNSTQTAPFIELQKHNGDNILIVDNDGSLILTGSMVVSGSIIMNVSLTDINNPYAVPTKEYVDSTASGLKPLGSVQSVAITDVNLFGNQTIDGYLTHNGDIVLLTGQNVFSENGPWIVSDSAWIRPSNFQSGSIIMGGSSLFVIAGGTYKNSTWVLTKGADGIVDVTDSIFTIFSQPGTPIASNVGGAIGTIFEEAEGNNFEFKTISGSNHIVITNNATTIDISSDGTSNNIPNELVARDGSGNFSAGTITATNLAGTVTTAAQPNITSVGTLGGLTMGGALNLGTNNITNGGTVTATNFTGSLTGTASGNLPLSGGILTGALRLPAGSTSSPALNFTGSTTTGFSAASGALSISTAGTERLKIASSGTLSVNAFSTAGVVHNDASGNLSSSLIVDADIASSAAIADSKLNTIVTSGKVANSATTATSVNTASTIVSRDGSGNFSAGTITATNVGGTLTTAAQPNITSVGTLTGLTMGGALNLGTNNITNGGTVTATNFTGSLTGTASGNLPLSGGILTGALRLPAGSTSSPALNFTGSTTTGFSAASGALSISTAGTERLKIASSGTLSVNAFSTAGVVHNDASGNLSSSLIVDADIASSAAIADSKLNTIVTSGKVANSATTATSVNTASTIVSRDGSGNFSAGTITATNVGGTLTTAAQPNITSVGTLTGLTMGGALNLGTNNITNGGTVTATNFTGSLTGTASGNLPLSGGILTGALRLPAGSTSSPALNFTGSTTTGFSAASGALSISTAGTERLKIASSGTLSVNAFSTAGVVHNDASGNLSSSLIVDADIASSAAIADSKLNTIVTSGKVANSATTATSVNTASTIVSRDGSGNFSAGTITATNVGGTLTTAAQPNITSLGTLTGLTINGTLVMGSNNIIDTGTITAGTLTATNVGGTLTTTAQPNVTSLGSLTGLTVNNSFTTGTSGKVLFLSGLCQQGLQYVTPIAGGTTTVAATTSVLIFNVVSNMNGQTIALPSTPLQGQMLTIVAGPANINALIFSGGTVVNAPTSLSSGNTSSRNVQLIYNSANTSWYVTSYAV